MYNMNASGLLPLPQGEGAGATPRTPEILNSLIAMTNPFDAMRGGGPRVASSPPSESTSSSCGSSISPPSVQHTCSQLIKEGLKLTIQTKRRNNPSSSASDDPPSKPPSRSDENDVLNPSMKLTPEDEERRRRRRERNKIAATKCRLKKRERTVNLVQESEILETQNHDLKSQIQDLENERRRLVDMLSVHRPTCSKQLPFTNAVSPPYQENYPACTNTNSVEPRSNHYTSYPGSYCKVEVDSETYHKSTNSIATENSYQRLEAVEESGFNRSHTTSVLTYHNFEQSVKEPATVLPFCRLVGDIGENYTRMEIGCNSVPLEPSHSYLRSHVSPTRQYSRPSTLGISTYSDYDKDILDSPSIAPTNYHHFDEDADNYTAGFPSGSCIT